MTTEDALTLQPGDPILYIPTHANRDRSHDDCEPGYVDRVDPSGMVSCRFFFPKKHSRAGELRTKANSERCYPYSLVRITLADLPPGAQITHSGGW